MARDRDSVLSGHHLSPQPSIKAVKKFTWQIYALSERLLVSAVTVVCAYTEMTNQQVLEKLETGWRHEKPASCTREMYDIMLTCWHKAPSQRPTFEHLFHTMDDYNVAVASSYADT